MRHREDSYQVLMACNPPYSHMMPMGCQMISVVDIFYWPLPLIPGSDLAASLDVCGCMQAALRRARAPAPAPAFAPAPQAVLAGITVFAGAPAPAAAAGAEAAPVYVSSDALGYMDSALAPAGAPFGVGAPDARYGFQPLLGPYPEQV